MAAHSDNFWLHFGTILGSLWNLFGVLVSSLWVPLGAFGSSGLSGVVFGLSLVLFVTLWYHFVYFRECLVLV